MSVHNWWEFGKKGAKWGAIAGVALVALHAVFGIATGGISTILGAAIVGGFGGSLIGAFTGDKDKDMVSIQTPSGRVIDVPAQDLERAQEMESRRFRDMVEQSRNGVRTR